MDESVFTNEWTDIRSKAKFEWLKLTEDDLNQVDGQIDRLVSALQKRYGYSHLTAEKIVDDWLFNLKH